jgi:amino acid adenylation domain-containing protein
VPMQPITLSPDNSSAKIAPLRLVRSLPEPMRTWSGARSEYPCGTTVSTLFEEIATEHARAIALVQDSVELTYEELNKRANHLAQRLRRSGVKPETMVACCFERSVEMVVAILAILKAGGAYVPLDPSYPKARLALILEDAGKPLIVTTQSLASSVLAEPSHRIILLDDDSESVSSSEGQQPTPQEIAGPTSLAYVMYTSGSTGRPKGVMVEHSGILRLVRGTSYCHFGPDEKLLQFAPFSFDASTFEIWGALLNGSTLVLMPPQSSSLEDLIHVIRKHGVTTLWLTAGLFHLMVEQHPDGLRTLRQLLAGGDILSSRHVRIFLEHAPNTTLINGYGPTENTTFTCCHVMRPGDPIPESIPIGRPVSNTRVYILDQAMNPVSPGEIGELCAAGDGVARGYLNDPDATATKFLPDPFTDEPSQRMYRTGDLARWRPDGTVEFVGRVDHQVKILGYRIEPGEIELALQQHGQVKQVCVIARAENSGKRLAAFFVPSSPDLTPDELREFAISQLPQHMVPAYFVSLPALPLSDNGKVDRTALSKLEIATKRGSATTNVPGSETERILTQLWERLLNIPTIGLDDNFFDLGGDSLLLVSVHSNLQRALQTKIPVTDLFEFPTIRKLARHLSQAKTNSGDFSDAKERAQRQREMFARSRGRRSGGES